MASYPLHSEKNKGKAVADPTFVITKQYPNKIEVASIAPEAKQAIPRDHGSAMLRQNPWIDLTATLT